MNYEQIAYLQARKLESFFREKIDLQYSSQNGCFTEYEVSQVNNKPVRNPITVGIAETSGGSNLYISADLSKSNQGNAKIEFDLSEDTLHGLEIGKHKLLFLDALQTAVSNRFMINAEEISGQSFLRSANRELWNTFTNPFHQLRDIFRFVTGTFPGGPFGKPLGDTVKQAKPIHILRNVHSFGKTILGLRNADKNPGELCSDYPSTPIYVRSPNLSDAGDLSPKLDYKLSFSRDCSRGIPRPKCILTPMDDNPNAKSFTLDYDGMRITDKGVDLYLSDRTITLNYSDRIKTRDKSKSDTEYGNEQEISTEKDRKTPSKTSAKGSLDSMIASAQTRAREQAARPSIQKNRTVMPGPDR